MIMVFSIITLHGAEAGPNKKLSIAALLRYTVCPPDGTGMKETGEKGRRDKKSLIFRKIAR